MEAQRDALVAAHSMTDTAIKADLLDQEDTGRRQLRTRTKKPGRFGNDPQPKRKKKYNPAAQPPLRLNAEQSKLKDWEVAADMSELASGSARRRPASKNRS